MEVCGQLRASDRVNPGAHWKWGWVGLTGSLAPMEKRESRLCQERNPRLSSRNLSHYTDYAIPASIFKRIIFLQRNPEAENTMGSGGVEV